MRPDRRPDVVEFERFRFDRRTGRLFRRADDGAFETVNLGSRATAILSALVDHAGELISKEEIIAKTWPGTLVDQSNLTVQVAALRRVLDRKRPGASSIQTVSGRGYRFILEVSEPAEAETSPLPNQVSCREDPAQGAGPYSGRTWSRVAVTIAVAVSLASAGVWDLVNGASTSVVKSGGMVVGADRRQSNMVLPFENGSGDPGQDELAEDITRRVTDLLARSGDMPTVPRMTANSYRGKVVDVQEIGRKYGVHFALVGTVRRQEGQLIVSAIMYKVNGGHTVWARELARTDGPHTAADIAQVIYEGCWQASVDEESADALRDHSDHLDKRDLILASLATRLSAARTKAHLQQRLSLIDRALKIDSNDLAALERQARLHAEVVMVGYSNEPTVDLGLAAQASERMMTIDPNALSTLRAKAFVLRAQAKWQEAEAVLRRAIAMQPTEANRRYELGQILVAEGRHEEAIASFEMARRFAGGADPMYLYDGSIAMAELSLGRLPEAINSARSSISESPPEGDRYTETAWLALIAAEASNGEHEASRGDLRDFLATPRSWGTIREVLRSPAFAANRNLIHGLSEAGMPAG